MMSGIVKHIAYLKELGAADRDHPGGNLLGHLVGTCCLLQSWGVRPALSLAGLYHATYGGDGQALISPSRRFVLRQWIGCEAEDIVFLYGGVPLGDLRHRFLARQSLRFESRFDGKPHWLGYQQIRDYCALVAAREIDIASRDRAYLAREGVALQALFACMAPWLGPEAQHAVHENFGAFAVCHEGAGRRWPERELPEAI